MSTLEIAARGKVGDRVIVLLADDENGKLTIRVTKAGMICDLVLSFEEIEALKDLLWCAGL